MDLHVQAVCEVLLVLRLRHHDQKIEIAIFLNTTCGRGAKQDDASRVSQCNNLVHNLANILS